MPVVVGRQVWSSFMQKAVVVLQLQFLGGRRHPFLAAELIPKVQSVRKTIEIPQQCLEHLQRDAEPASCPSFDGSFTGFCVSRDMRNKFLATVVDARSISSIRQVFYGHAVLGQGCCCAHRGSTTGALVLTVVPQSQFIVGCRLPRLGDESNPHGSFFGNVRDSTVAVHVVVDVLL